MPVPKVVKARTQMHRANRVKNEWHKQFKLMRKKRDILRDAIIEANTIIGGHGRVGKILTDALVNEAQGEK